MCIPSYNAARTISETIQSVLDSTYADLEIIVNDDASTDETPVVVAACCDADARVRLYRNESNVGPARNWNRALKRATGEFVGLLNHDDLYGPFWLARAVHVLDKHPHIGWVMSAYRVIDGAGRSDHVTVRFPQTGEVSRSEAFRRIALLDGLGVGYIARRAVLEQVGYYDEDAGPSADNDLFLRLAVRYPLYYSTFPHVAWRQYAGNLTNRWGLVEQVADCLRILRQAFDDESLPEELRAHERSCYTYYYQKVLDRARERLEQGDLDTVRQVILLLHTDGYRGWEKVVEKVDHVL
ncbi:MAG: glycosyltransferase [Chloroflexi bacterium]|nr:glycosyltransferase [Chloroflexota bacterium]